MHGQDYGVAGDTVFSTNITWFTENAKIDAEPGCTFASCTPFSGVSSLTVLQPQTLQAAQPAAESVSLTCKCLHMRRTVCINVMMCLWLYPQIWLQSIAIACTSQGGL